MIWTCRLSLLKENNALCFTNKSSIIMVNPKYLVLILCIYECLQYDDLSRQYNLSPHLTLGDFTSIAILRRLCCMLESSVHGIIKANVSFIAWLYSHESCQSLFFLEFVLVLLVVFMLNATGLFLFFWNNLVCYRSIVSSHLIWISSDCICLLSCVIPFE